MTKINFENLPSTNTPLSAENLNQMQTNIENAINEVLNKLYPVGSIYISVNSTSPATIYGGTWEQLQNRFLLGAGSSYTAGTTGGEATHTLTVNEMPSHSHKLVSNTSQGTSDAISIQSTFPGTDNNVSTRNSSAVGGGQAHNNMPPYLVVYMWKRTA